jgi:hypothetical protein
MRWAKSLFALAPTSSPGLMRAALDGSVDHLFEQRTAGHDGGYTDHHFLQLAEGRRDAFNVPFRLLRKILDAVADLLTPAVTPPVSAPNLTLTSSVILQSPNRRED